MLLQYMLLPVNVHGNVILTIGVKHLSSADQPSGHEHFLFLLKNKLKNV